MHTLSKHHKHGVRSVHILTNTYSTASGVPTCVFVGQNVHTHRTVLYSLIWLCTFITLLYMFAKKCKRALGVSTFWQTMCTLLTPFYNVCQHVKQRMRSVNILVNMCTSFTPVLYVLPALALTGSSVALDHKEHHFSLLGTEEPVRASVGSDWLLCGPAP